MNRRSFMKGAASAAAIIPFNALIARAAEPDRAVRGGHTAGYGPLFETLDGATGLPLLMLPQGFRYVSFGWTGDIMASGRPTPGVHDGMAAFAAGRGRARRTKTALGERRNPRHCSARRRRVTTTVYPRSGSMQCRT